MQRATYTVPEFQAEFGWSRSYIYKMLRGERPLPAGVTTEQVGRTWQIHVAGGERSPEETFFERINAWMPLDSGDIPEPLDFSLRWDRTLDRRLPPTFTRNARNRRALNNALWQRLQNGNHLLKVLAVCHQMASEGINVSINLNFTAGGEWSTEVVRPDHEPILETLILGNNATARLIELWLRELRPTADRSRMRIDICLNCGASLVNQRRNRFCSGPCQINFADWIGRLRNRRGRQIGRSIVARLHRQGLFNLPPIPRVSRDRILRNL